MCHGHILRPEDFGQGHTVHDISMSVIGLAEIYGELGRQKDVMRVPLFFENKTPENMSKYDVGCDVIKVSTRQGWRSLQGEGFASKMV